MSGISKTNVQKERIKKAIDSGGSSVEKLINKKTQARFCIGIDVGIINGFSVWDRQFKKLEDVFSCQLWELFIYLDFYNDRDVEVFIENPNTWKPFGISSKEKLQGAGAVKQTYKHIIEFLEFKKIPYTPTKIQGNLKKVNKVAFAKITQWGKVTNEHSRDAAMIVFNR